MKFPKHKASLHLSHNVHLSLYKTVAQAIEDEDLGYCVEDWVSEKQMQEAIETNDCWFLQWYPDTPIGFQILAAADLGILLAAVAE